MPPLDPERFVAAVVSKIKTVLTGWDVRLAALEQRALVPGPIGDRGPQGEKGLDGQDGAVGPAGQQGEPGRAGEPGAPGRAGEPGAKGLDGTPGRDGVDGVAGRDGIGLAGAVITKEGELVVTLTDGTLHRLGLVVGQPGAIGPQGEKGLNGTDGADGTLLSLKALAAAMRPAVDADGRTVKWLWADGSPVEGWSVKFATVLYRGVFTDGQTYEPGDMATWGGSTWYAKETTTAKPGEAAASSRAWVLAVKAGRDGKGGPQGPQGTPGAKGDKGDRGFDR